MHAIRNKKRCEEIIKKMRLFNIVAGSISIGAIIGILTKSLNTTRLETALLGCFAAVIVVIFINLLQDINDKLEKIK